MRGVAKSVDAKQQRPLQRMKGAFVLVNFQTQVARAWKTLGFGVQEQVLRRNNVLVTELFPKSGPHGTLLCKAVGALHSVRNKPCLELS